MTRRPSYRPTLEERDATRAAGGSTVVSLAAAVTVFFVVVSSAEVRLAQTASAMRLTRPFVSVVQPEPLIQTSQWTLMTFDESVWTVDVRPPAIENTNASAPAKETVKPAKPKPVVKPRLAVKPKPRPIEAPKPIESVEPRPEPTVQTVAPDRVETAGSARESVQTDGSVKAEGVEMDVINELIARIERYKQYPKRARDAGLEGVVTLIVEVDATGKVTETEMAPGGNALFRRATRSAAKHLKDYRTRADRAFRLEIPVRYRLD